MAAYEELQALQDVLPVLQPRACGCVHERVTEFLGRDDKPAFCGLAARLRNPACAHLPLEADGMVGALIQRARLFSVISEEECDRFGRMVDAAKEQLLNLDREAQLRAMESNGAGEIRRDTLDNHPDVDNIRDRQRPHVETLQDVLDVLRTRLAALLPT